MAQGALLVYLCSKQQHAIDSADGLIEPEDQTDMSCVESVWRSRGRAKVRDDARFTGTGMVRACSRVHVT